MSRKLKVRALCNRIRELEGSIREVAIPSFEYYEKTLDIDDMARSNLEAVLKKPIVFQSGLRTTYHAPLRDLQNKDGPYING